MSPFFSLALLIFQLDLRKSQILSKLCQTCLPDAHFGGFFILQARRIRVDQKKYTHIPVKNLLKKIESVIMYSFFFLKKITIFDIGDEFMVINSALVQLCWYILVKLNSTKKKTGPHVPICSIQATRIVRTCFTSGFFLVFVSLFFNKT